MFDPPGWLRVELPLFALLFLLAAPPEFFLPGPLVGFFEFEFFVLEPSVARGVFKPVVRLRPADCLADDPSAVLDSLAADEFLVSEPD